MANPDNAPFDWSDPAPHFFQVYSPSMDGAIGGLNGVQTMVTIPDLVRTQLGTDQLAQNPAQAPGAAPCSWWDFGCKASNAAQGVVAYAGVLLLGLVVVYAGFQFFVHSGEGAN